MLKDNEELQKWDKYHKLSNKLGSQEEADLFDFYWNPKTECTMLKIANSIHSLYTEDLLSAAKIKLLKFIRKNKQGSSFCFPFYHCKMAMIDEVRKLSFYPRSVIRQKKAKQETIPNFIDIENCTLIHSTDTVLSVNNKIAFEDFKSFLHTSVSPREKCITLKLLSGMTQKEIAKEYNITSSCVSQAYRTAIKKFKLFITQCDI